MSIDTCLGRLAGIPQFFIWRLEANVAKGKFDKTPCALDGSAYRIDASASSNWTGLATARAALSVLPQQGNVRYALGFWMTPETGAWFIDIDKGVSEQGLLHPLAKQLVDAYPGAMTEYSSSGRGIHIIGSGIVPAHRNKPEQATAAQFAPLELEFYTSGRGIAFGLDGRAWGSADARFDMTTLVTTYFPPRVLTPPTLSNIGSAHVAYRGPYDDDVLIERFMKSRPGPEAAFGGKATLQQLWRGEVDQKSEADGALAAHLLWWTGGDVARVERLMRRSALVRPKWNESRPGGTYISTTIAGARELVTACYVDPQQTSGDGSGANNATTELANAYRLTQQHGSEMMFVPGVGWHVWNGKGPWLQDDHAAYRLGFNLGKSIQLEADALDDWVYQATLDGLGLEECKRREKFQHARASWAKASESRSVIFSSLALAENLLAIPADSLDASRYLVGCPAGVLDLSLCAVRPHQQGDRITKRIACDYDSAARAPTWERFVHEIMGGSSELSDYLQTLCGYVLSGERGEHLLPVFHGTGANGKSTFLSTLQALMGDYAGTAAPGLLISRNGTDHPTGLASLQGKRLVVVSETGESGKLNEEQVKQLTGGDRISARRMRQDFYEFDPTHLIVLQTNHKPRVTGTDEGIWRRVKLIPFNVTIPPERRDATLGAKLLAELPGILAWMVEGWRKYKAHGFKEPQAVKVATAEYRSASDHVGAFIEDRCNVGPTLSVNVGVLYVTYKGWCAENGEYPLTQRALGLRLAERPGLSQGRSAHARAWRGLGIASHVFSGGIPTL